MLQESRFKKIFRFLIAFKMAGLFLLTAFAMSDEAEVSNIDNTRAALDKWVETRRIISQEKHDFELGKEMINERTEIVEREIDSLKSKMGDADKSITEADKNRTELVEENEKLKKASSSLNGTITELENHTKELLKRLPDIIRERVKPLSQRFPDNPKDTKLSLSERFQNVIGVLNEVNKFNREITANSEVRTLPDGKAAEVTALYLGIGRAYYVSNDRKIAGTGAASATEWVWTPDNKSASQIADAIAVLKNEKVATFVQLPIDIH